jgi:hypothetical protein
MSEMKLISNLTFFIFAGILSGPQMSPAEKLKQSCASSVASTLTNDALMEDALAKSAFSPAFQGTRNML